MKPDDRPSAREAASILAHAVGVRPVLGDQEAEADEKSDSVLAEQTTGDAVPAQMLLRDPRARPVVPVVVTRHGGGRMIALVVAALAAAVAAVLIFSFDGQNAQPPAFGFGTTQPPAGNSAGTTGSAGPATSQGQAQSAGTGQGPNAGGVPVSGTTPRQGTSAPPRTTTRPPATTGPSTSPTQTFRDPPSGNAIRANCVNGLAHLVAYRAATGYVARVAEQGPAATVKIGFRSQSQIVYFRVRCQAGTPQARIDYQSPQLRAEPRP